MSVLGSLRKPPFNLSDSDLEWVSETLAGLSGDDRIRQLFVHISMGDDPNAIRDIMATKPGGLCRFIGESLESASNGTRLALELSDIPPFVTGDLEGGGHLSPAMTRMQNPLGLAAANDLALSEAST